MPLLKARTRGKDMLRVVTRIDRPNHETLTAYAEFLDESTDYVLNELIDTVLAKDKDFVKWRAEQDGAVRPSSTNPPHRTALAHQTAAEAVKGNGHLAANGNGTRPA